MTDMAIDNLTGNESVEELQQLYAVAENRLRILDEKRSYTKPEIYQKVRAEYEAKVFELRVLLEEKGAGLQQSLDAAVAESDAMVARHHQLADELEELELRAAIGEVDDDSYAARQRELQQEMSGIDAALEELSAKIENYRQLIDSQGAPPQTEPAQPPAPVAAVPPPPAAPRPAPAKPATPAVPSRPVVPVPQPLRPAAHPPAPEAARPAPQPAAVQAPRPAPKPPDPTAPVPEPITDPAAPTAEMEELERQFASILSSTIAEPPQDVKPSIGEVFAPAPAAAAPESAPEADPGPVESESHEGELKCPKCQAFNRADNWYCEKCGNELLNANDLLGGTK